MYKLISPRELTEIITGLLLKPELLGELDSPEKHRMFMADLGRVVAEHCGGLVNSVVLPGTEVTVPDGLPLNGQPVRYLGIKESIPHLLVEPDASLPSLAKNVWMYADPEGWKEHFGAEEDCLTPEMMQLFRKGIQALQKEHDTPEISLTLQDWRLEEETLREEDSQAYQVSVTGQHNIHCEVVNKEGNPCFGVMFEIDQGVPALHINTGGDMLLHIHCAHNGLVLTPDASGQRFEKAPVDRFAYNSPSLLLSAD